MDFSQGLTGGFGDGFSAAGTSLLSGITGQLGNLLGGKIAGALGLAQKPPSNAAPASSNASANAQTPTVALNAVPVSAPAAAGWSTGAIVAASVGGLAVVGLLVVAAVKLAK